MSHERISETAETEKIADSIVEIWREILSRDDIARDTHFLDLGGDSLDAMRTAVRIEQRFGTEFTLEEFFTDSATAMGQAKQILKNRVL